MISGSIPRTARQGAFAFALALAALLPNSGAGPARAQTTAPPANPPAAAPPVPASALPESAPSIGVPPPEGSLIEEVLVSAPEPRYVAPTTRDRIGRIWAPVTINGKGPFRLVLDTGASRSAITQSVADRLGVPIKPNGAKLKGVTGSAIVPTVRIDTMEFGELIVENVTLPIVPEAFGGAEGVLGGDGLHDKRITIEFKRDRISILRSRRAPAPAGYSVVPFTYSGSGGMRVQVQVGGIPVLALIDTGGQATVGNSALREALARKRGERDPVDGSVIGVTTDVQAGSSVRIPTIVAGKLVVRRPEVMFTDLHIFDHWALRGQPALLIGMDVLGTVDTLVIDYRRHELHIKPN
jgi:predicted aspartyl protease